MLVVGFKYSCGNENHSEATTLKALGDVKHMSMRITSRITTSACVNGGVRKREKEKKDEERLIFVSTMSQEVI